MVNARFQQGVKDGKVSADIVQQVFDEMIASTEAIAKGLPQEEQDKLASMSSPANSWTDDVDSDLFNRQFKRPNVPKVQVPSTFSGGEVATPTEAADESPPAKQARKQLNQLALKDEDRSPRCIVVICIHVHSGGSCCLYCVGT
jgi:hypothetical protein